jgi:hypothetical protein
MTTRAVLKTFAILFGVPLVAAVVVVGAWLLSW